MNNTTSWLLWLFMTVAFLLSTRNPIYLLVILIGLFVLGAWMAKRKHQPFWLRQNLRFLLTMVFLSTMINALFTHTGQTILFTIPEGWPLIGGAFTLESLVYGMINGLVIGSLYLVFNIINLALSIKQLTRLIPPALHPIAVMVTIALTFFPSIQQRAREIKEAQMIRGNPMKKVSDWLPLLMPLLVTSLEKAILLSESMTARGFHTQPRSNASSLAFIGSITATFAVFSGWILRLYSYPDILSIILYIFGASILTMTLFLTGRQSKITHFHHEEWQMRDVLGTTFFIIILAGFIIFNITDRLPSLAYSPYPSLSWPSPQIIGVILSTTSITPIIFSCHD